jgi:hypothetical protein
MTEQIHNRRSNDQWDELFQIGQLAVTEAQEESRRLGVANVYFKNGQTYYEWPNGELRLTPPPPPESNGG